MAKGSHNSWAGWEPRVCYVCGKPITHKHASGHSFAGQRSWHAACASSALTKAKP